MKKIIKPVLALVLFTSAGCTNTEKGILQDDTSGYDSIISFISDGYICQWQTMSPDDMDLSYIYGYRSPSAGYCRKDINGDGIEELLIGDFGESWPNAFYDIFTVNPSDGSPVHLAKGGERDFYSITGEGIIVENGSNNAEDSFKRGYMIKDGRLVEVKNWQETEMVLHAEAFFSGIVKENEQLCGGYTGQREISEEEMAMFIELTSDSRLVLTPLSVSTQVVAGLNYKFWCRCKGDTEGHDHCFVTIYKSLDGSKRITGIDFQ